MANKYLQASGNWDAVTWYDAASGGNVVAAPGAGDTAFLNTKTLYLNVTQTYACGFNVGGVLFLQAANIVLSGAVTVLSGGYFSPYTGATAISLTGSMSVALGGFFYSQANIACTLTVASGATLTLAVGIIVSSNSGASIAINVADGGTFTHTIGPGTVTLSQQPGSTVTFFGQRVYVAGDSVDPGVSNVLTSAGNYTINGVSKTPTYHAPEASEVISTAVFGPNSGTAGTYSVVNVVAANIKSGVEIGGVTGTLAAGGGGTFRGVFQ